MINTYNFARSMTQQCPKLSMRVFYFHQKFGIETNFRLVLLVFDVLVSSYLFFLSLKLLDARCHLMLD